jgi:hypothetical protein
LTNGGQTIKLFVHATWLINTARNIMNSSTREINAIVSVGDYPKLDKEAISQINHWLKNKFGVHFQCQTVKEAIRLIKTISAWSKQHQHELKTYIDNDLWQGQRMDALTFQSQVLAKGFERTPKRKKVHTLKKMLNAILSLFCSQQQFPIESTFEKNKVRNFIASSKLEGINLDEN